MKILPAVSVPTGARLARHTGVAANLRCFRHEPDRHGDASILLAAEFVGIGDTAGADVGLTAPGIRVVIAPGFGPEFFSEAVRQGVLLVPLAVDVIDRLADRVRENPRAEMTVDLEAQVIEMPGLAPVAFAAHPRLRDKLLFGLEDLDELLQYREEAVAFRKADRSNRPWLYSGGGDS